jgi:hypothetical protein
MPPRLTAHADGAVLHPHHCVMLGQSSGVAVSWHPGQLAEVYEAPDTESE